MQQISPEIDTQTDTSLGVSSSQDLSFSKQFPKATNLNLFLGIGFLALFLTSTVFIWQKGNINISPFSPSDSKQNDESQSVTAQAESDESKLKNFFHEAVPRPLEEVTIFDLPNYRKIQGAAKYKNNLWFTGNGNIIEYSLQTNSIISYSDAN